MLEVNNKSNLVEKRNSNIYPNNQSKRNLNDLLAFYWGSNQNMWGKTPTDYNKITSKFNESPSRLLQEIEVSSPSGWESNQNFFGKRNRNNMVSFNSNVNPFWVSRGKRQVKNKLIMNPMLSNAEVEQNKETESLINSEDKPNELKVRTKVFPGSIRNRRDTNGEDFWISRGKKDSGDPFWVPRGRRSEQMVVNLKDSFWAPRGKKPDIGENPLEEIVLPYVQESSEEPFWVPRGRRFEHENMDGNIWTPHDKRLATNQQDNEDSDKQFWVPRGKKESVNGPFWTPRGKRPDGQFWINRGKRTSISDSYINPIAEYDRENDEEKKYFINNVYKNLLSAMFLKKILDQRPKKETFASPEHIENAPNSFWMTRGRKSDESQVFNKRSNEELRDEFWIPRGKKSEDYNYDDDLELQSRAERSEEVNNNFWVPRGKKPDGKFWVPRGKKELNQPKNFWVSRGKRNPLPLPSNIKLPQNNNIWTPRGKRSSIIDSDRSLILPLTVSN